MAFKESPNKGRVQSMRLSEGRVYLVEGTVSAKVLRWEPTWVLEGPKGGPCDWNAVGEEGGCRSKQSQGRLCRAPAEHWSRKNYQEFG